MPSIIGDKTEDAKATTPMLQSIGRVSVLTTAKDGELLLTGEGRPLAEPPIFNYDSFVREYVPSDGKLKKMFGDNPVPKTSYSDVETELNILVEFRMLAKVMLSSLQVCGEKVFYTSLEEDLNTELCDVVPEQDLSWSSFTDLQRWEARYLDNDDENGNTTAVH